MSLVPRHGTDGEYWVVHKGQPVRTYLRYEAGNSYGEPYMFSNELWRSFNAYTVSESYYRTREECVAEHNKVVQMQLDSLKNKLI